MLKDIVNHLQYIPRALLLSVLFLLSFLFIRENRGKAAEKLKKLIKYEGWTALFLFYTALLLTSAVLARTHTNPLQDPIGTFGLMENGKPNSDGLINTAAFVPYTFLFIKAFHPERPWKSCLLLSAATSIFFELCQLLFWLGWFAAADIFHNILGGMIGCGLWYVRENRLISRGWKRICKTLLLSLRLRRRGRVPVPPASPPVSSLSSSESHDGISDEIP